MKLSIIIPTLNRSQDLNQCLLSLSNQDYTSFDYEIIVCDNNSNDNTSEIVEEFNHKIKNLKYLIIKKPGLHEGRHAGLKSSNSEWLAFIDDDVKLPSNWISEIIKTIDSRPNEIMIGSKVLPFGVSEFPRWIKKIWDTQNIIGELSLVDCGSKPRYISPTIVFGCSFIIRKTFLNEIGGFHPDSMPLELIHLRGDGETHVSVELSKRGREAFYNPDIITYHKVSADRLSKKYFQKRRYAQGISDAYTYLRNQYFNNEFVDIIDNKSSYGFKIKNFFLNIIYFNWIKNKILPFNNNSYLDGYNFLIEKFHSDSDLKDWILKPNYLSND